jgi:hypothetical protein
VHHPIYLFRHGETVWNAEKRAQGYLDSPLTETGRAQGTSDGPHAGSRSCTRAGYAPATSSCGPARSAGARDLALARRRRGSCTTMLPRPSPARDELGRWDGLNAGDRGALAGHMAVRGSHHWNYCPPTARTT